MIDLPAIRARLERATKGPWTWDGPHTVNGGPGMALAVMAGQLTVGMVGFDRGDPETEAASRADADLIAHAPADIAALLSHVASLEARLREVEAERDAALEELAGEEW